MSKVSYILIAVMAAALLYMGAARGFQVYKRYASEKAAEEAANGQAFTFQNVPVTLAAPRPEPVNRPIAFESSQTAIFIEDAPLSDEGKTQQAQDTITSILADYKEDSHLQQFNKDLSHATKGAAEDLGALGGVDLVKILKQNPQVDKVVQQHMKNPEFAKTVEQIFTNPQFIESVKQLQGAMAPQTPAPAKKAE